MNISPEIKDWLERLNTRYCKQLGIKPKSILLYNVADLNKLDTDLTHYKLHKKDGFSVFNDKERHTYINVKAHKTAAELIDTLVHELLHIYDDKLSHGREFQKKVDDIIIGIFP